MTRSILVHQLIQRCFTVKSRSIKPPAYLANGEAKHSRILGHVATAQHLFERPNPIMNPQAMSDSVNEKMGRPH